MKNSLSRNSDSFKEENLEAFYFLIEESCPQNNIKIIDLPLDGKFESRFIIICAKFSNTTISF